MENLQKREKDMYHGLWVGTIILAILIFAFWFIPIVKNEFDFELKIKLTLASFTGLIGAWLLFLYQKRKDKELIPKKEKAIDKLIKYGNIFHGVSLKIVAIKFGIFSFASFIGGLYFLITQNKYWWIGLIFIGISIALVIIIITFWKLSRQKIKGRYY